MKTHCDILEMSMAEKLVATKLAQASWMNRHDGATEKSFFRIQAGLRNMMINDAYYLVKTAESLGMKLTVENL